MAPVRLGSTIPVLMYHSVSRIASGPLRSLAVPPQVLREHLDALTGAGYRLVGLSEALDLLATEPGTRVVALTFDDGYLNFLRQGLPELLATGARATLYAPVSHLGRLPGWLGPQAEAVGPLLTWSQLREVAAAGMEIGNHGLVHHPLDVLRPVQRDREIAESRDQLAQALGTGIRSFCYPHGYHVRGVRITVGRTGHDNACQIGYRLYQAADDDRLAIPRLQPTPDHRGADVLRLAHMGDGWLLPQVKRVAGPGWRATRRVALDVFGKRLT